VVSQNLRGDVMIQSSTSCSLFSYSKPSILFSNLLIIFGLLIPLLSSAWALQDERIFSAQIPVTTISDQDRWLAADIYLPDKPGPFPTIFIFTPYDKNRLWMPMPGNVTFIELFGENYAIVAVDWPGYFGSKDAAVPAGMSNRKLLTDDGQYVVNWIADQDWCDSDNIGMWGSSALGVAQYMTAVGKPTGLKCIVPIVARFGESYSTHYNGGVFNLAHAYALECVGFKGAMKILMTCPIYNNFWKIIEMGTWLNLSALDLPIFIIGGWYDIDTGNLIKNFNRIRTIAGPEARQNVKLLMGPWDHMRAHTAPLKLGDLEFPEAEYVSCREAIRFFDYWLRDQKANGWNNEPSIRYFQMGTQNWESADMWPPPQMEDRIFYLGIAGTLTSQPETGDVSEDSFIYDPLDPSPTVGGMVIHLNYGLCKDIFPGPIDQRAEVESRSDYIAYTSELLSQDIAVKGQVKTKLYVSSDQIDTDLVIRLCDVYPDGRSIIITEGAHRMRFRDSLSDPEFMTPGEIYEVTVSCSITAHTFQMGHRIRILITSSNYPRFAVNPNNGDDFLTDKGNQPLVATNSIYHDQAYPSSLILPCEPMP
jgi:predicted acyl esterase